MEQNYNPEVMSAFRKLFAHARPVIAMIHVGALPGTPAHSQSLKELEARAERESRIFAACGVQGLLVENMHDTPYLRGRVGPEIVASLAVVARAVKEASRLPCGIQILAAANLEAMAVAHAANLDFIRAEGFAFAHVADEGIIQSSAAELLRFRRAIGAQRIAVWADVKKKHSSHAITADLTVGDVAAAVEFMRADAVIVTGPTTGEEPSDADIGSVRRQCRLPVYLGSGITADNLGSFYTTATGFIVGSYFKMDGRWSETVDPRRVERFMEAYALGAT